MNDAIERITTSGSVSIVATLPPKSDPEQFVVGADGNISFSEGGVDGIGRIDTSGSVTQIPLAITKGTVGLAAGPDHRLWLGGLQTVYRVSY